MVLKHCGWHGSTCTCTCRVGAVLHEKKIPFEFINVDLGKGEHKIAAFIAIHPFGQHDDGFILYESRAIGRYLETKYLANVFLLRQDDLASVKSNGKLLDVLFEHDWVGG
ncbi:hypothetical protein DXG03_006925 [Asterophora parasitica]|uniref:glutathione transferase n=1 Tax=Asterophora parasitica TaxID=117018 RepID=A0A9P7G8D6_9AGAR|nr:hypothetical protein DXG03_006925 [Asterophora parasitica]